MTAQPINTFDPEDMEDLDSIESFFQYFGIDYDPAVITHQRIHLLRLFNHNLQTFSAPLTDDHYRTALNKAYCLLKSDQKLAFNEPACGSCKECH